MSEIYTFKLTDEEADFIGKLLSKTAFQDEAVDDDEKEIAAQLANKLINQMLLSR
jgi:hypothetical protein